MKTLIAIVLYKVGIRPNVSMFIDGETLTYGYGKLNGWIGVWDYDLPAKYIKGKTK